MKHWRIHQQNVNQSGSYTQTSQILRLPSPVPLSTSRCSQAPLELCKVLSDSARALSGASESTCSYGCAFRTQWDWTNSIVKFWSRWDLSTGLWETWRATPGKTCISKMELCHWEPLGVSESCWTRITGWSNPRVDWTDAVAFRCTWEHLGAPTTSLGAPATSLGACRITVEQSGRNNIFFGNAASVPGNHSYYLSFNDF